MALRLVCAESCTVRGFCFWPTMVLGSTIGLCTQLKNGVSCFKILDWDLFRPISVAGLIFKANLR